ncbi:MAG TPA: class I tRNA ligase family protein [Solirubrobacteraceae bacterium]|nr:class I tRNA ligase family protein [Solirubrobacteraceae bacterium]
MNGSPIDATPSTSPPLAGIPTTSDSALHAPRELLETDASSPKSFSTRGADYSPGPIETRWQAAWMQARAFAVPPPQDEREPAYVFAGCPFTSGDAHMGHIRSYTIADAYARFLRARGRAVLFSLGFDSFGLPAELEALRRGISPQAWVARCCERMRGQFEALGYSCDWERTFVSSEPEHYRWTQWLFLAMLERGLVYQHEAQVSWCDSCQTVLATLQAEDGTCWRCHSEVRFVRLPQWFMRITAYVQDNERGLEALPGWDRAAIGAQRAVLGRVDGVELDAQTFDGGALTVFTPHPEAIGKAAFVAVSPAHPDADRWISVPDVAAQLAGMREAGWRREDREAEQVPVAQTGAMATVPGVAGMLPIVISPLVDARFGPTAALGIPELDPTDRSIAERLPAPAGTTWKAGKASGAPRPAVRYRARDFAISRQRAWGAPIPLVHCPACGTVPVPFADLPVRLPDDLQISGEGGNPLASRPDFYECLCPRCGAAAKRETDTIDCHVDGMWMWMPICVPPEGRSTAMFSHPEYARWLPAEQIVWGADAGGYMFDQRLIGKVLQDLDQLPALPDREPFEKALMHQMIRLEGRKMSKHLGNVVDPNELVATVGADTVRLAVLHAASPGRIFNWNEQPVRYCQIFLKKLYGYAEGRLREWSPSAPSPAEQASTTGATTGANGASDGREAGADPRIDPSDKLRRRLANWCSVACEKVTENYEGLEMQRAAHNTMLLLTRIQDFEQRALDKRGGELEDADREAVVAALLTLVQMLAPIAPHVAEELWSLAGRDTLVSNAPWPTPRPRESEGTEPAPQAVQSAPAPRPEEAVPTGG